MKKLFVAIVLIVIMTMSCSSSKPANFSGVMGKEWKLIEVRLDGKSINFDRNTLAEEGFEEIFTLTFDSENNVSGTGAPNRYSAPYTLEKNQGVSIKMVRATLMAAIREPEKLKEHDFFGYIQNVNEWNLVNNSLELQSKTENGVAVTLIFTQ